MNRPYDGPPRNGCRSADMKGSGGRAGRCIVCRVLGARRAEGLAAAGYHQLGAFRDKVLDVALNGKGIERNAAIYALGFYGRDVPEPVLRRLIASEDVGLRSNAIVGARHAVPPTGHPNRRCPLCPGDDGPGARAGRSCGEGQAR
jgi:hypothetical protein